MSFATQLRADLPEAKHQIVASRASDDAFQISARPSRNGIASSMRDASRQLLLRNDVSARRQIGVTALLALPQAAQALGRGTVRESRCCTTESFTRNKRPTLHFLRRPKYCCNNLCSRRVGKLIRSTRFDSLSSSSMLSSHSSLGSTNGNDPLQPPRLMGVSNVRERVVSLSMSLPRHERLRSGSNMASSANLLGSTTSSRHLVESGEWWGVPALLERQPGPAIVKPLTGHHDVPKLSSCFVKTWSDMVRAHTSDSSMVHNLIQNDSSIAHNAILATASCIHCLLLNDLIDVDIK
eukprot:6190955-Pleurochrysis_carterae.AAC.2